MTSAVANGGHSDATGRDVTRRNPYITNSGSNGLFLI